VTIQQTFQSALQHHQAGRLAEAEALYRQVLALEPRQADAFHLLGVIAMQVGRNELAVDLIGQAIALKPSYPEAYYNLGIALSSGGKLDAAIAAYRHALSLKADHPEALNNLGNALKDNRQLDEAIIAYRQAITLRPHYPEAHYNLGLALYGKDQRDQAIAACHQAIALKLDYPEAHCALGNALNDEGRLDDAITAYRQAIAFKPDFPEVHSNLGNALKDKGQLVEAEAACRRAIALRRDFPEAYSNLGNVLKDSGQLDEAVAVCEQAIALAPHLSEARYNLGVALHEKGQFDEAIAAYRRAIAGKPEYPEAYSDLGNALKDNGQLDEAIAAYRHAIVLRPNLPEAHFNLALALLAKGDFSAGWEEYEWRWRLRREGLSSRDFTQPHWDGSLLEGRTILLHAEQGFGDTLQFIRYAPLVAERGGCVIVECQPGLATLLASVANIAQVVNCGERLPAFDVHCPLMSLARIFGTQLDSIPARVPYLRADAQKVARWRDRLAREKTSMDGSDSGRSELLKIGLVWAGGARPAQPNAARIDRRRSLALSQFAPLAKVPGVVFVSLQTGGPANQALNPPEGMWLLDWTAALHDFADTAALVESLDLVISVDTAIAHLAGALGKPVWVPNRFDSCWRWLRGRTDSPWYPTLRLFQQATPGEWGPVIEQVADALRKTSASHSRHSSRPPTL